MDMLERKDLKELIEEKNTCVSIFIPTHRTSEDAQQDSIRLKNTLIEAERKLREFGLKVPETKSLLDPAYRLQDSYIFRNHDSDGLAIFISPNMFKYYRLPAFFNEIVVVAGRFHIKPLLNVFAADALFYILAISKKEVRFLQASHYNVSPVNLENIPKGMSEVLKYDVFDTSLQFHTQTPVYSTPGKREAMFYGQGGVTDDAKENIYRYFKQVDHGLKEALKEEKAPLVISAVDYLIPIYLKANTYAYVLEKGIIGNPDELSDVELRDRAWKLVEFSIPASRKRDFSRYLDLSTGPRTSGNLGDILPASYDGRIDILFVADGINQWGHFQEDNRELALSDKQETGMDDLINLAAVQTILHSGTVHTMSQMEMEAHSPIAAIFRY
ncbi:MAG: hypothetical protein ABFD50_00615 [Smithella sp.]